MLCHPVFVFSDFLFPFLDDSYYDADCVVSSADYSLNNSLLTGWINNLTLHDEKVLNSQACLTANHISATLKLLKIQFPNQNGLQDTAYLCQKLSWNSLLNDFIQIINVDSHHWACLSNIFCTDENSVDLYDSAHTAPSADGSIVQQVSIILDRKCFNINLINVPLQFGGTDCGLFAIAMATDLASRTDPCSVTIVNEGSLEALFRGSETHFFP